MSTNDKYRRLRTFTGQQLREAAMDLIDHLERSQAAAQGSVASSTLIALAQDYDEATTDSHRALLASHIAESIPLAEAGTIRRAAEAIKLATPGIICRAAADGMEPNAIARELGATGSYVRRILRENPALAADAAKTRAAADNE
ncbi:hypothetical protein OG900_32020 [Streptomyces sp. NBC_00433]